MNPLVMAVIVITRNIHEMRRLKRPPGERMVIMRSCTPIPRLDSIPAGRRSYLADVYKTEFE